MVTPFVLRFVLPMLLVTLAAAAGAGEPTRIDLGSGPLDGTRTVVLKELWRTGNNDDDVFFGNALQVISGPEDQVRVLDSQLHQTFVFTADGTFLRTLGARGEGPGEVNNINSILDMGDGMLGLGQVLPGKLVLVDGDGQPAGAIRITDPEAPDSGFVLLMGGHAHGDVLALHGMRWTMDGQGHMGQDQFYRLYDRTGAAGRTLWSKTTNFDVTRFVFDENGYDFVGARCGFLPDGRIAFAPHRNAYAVHVCAADGTPTAILTRSYESWPRTADERREAELSNEAIGSHYGRELVGVTIEDTEPDITALWPDEAGLLWVRTSRGDRERPADVLTTVDVLDPEGRYLRRLALKCPGDPRRDGIHFLPGGRVVVVTGAIEASRREQATTRGGNEEVALEVICYGPAD